MITAAAVSAALCGGMAVAASPASAASSCWYSGGHWWCSNSYGVPVYGANTSGPDPTHVIGYMYSTTSWFKCRIDNGPYVGGPHPHRWEFTQADTATSNDGWGWMKDTAISSETNTLPTC
jgi:hypothetical protein